MTSQPADEDILIDAARAERNQHRSGASMAALLGIAVFFGAVGIVLIVVPHVLSGLLPGPLALLGGFSIPVLLTLGIGAMAIAGLFLLVALASSPMTAWGNAMPGKCPRCGEARLRSDIVPSTTSESASGGPRGLVTLCDNRECDYTAARVTRASRTS
jgi:predicted small integral membrane protein